MTDIQFSLKPGLVKLSEIVPLPRNPKDHDVGGLHTSMDRFGFLERIVINKTTGHMLGGEGRWKTLKQRHETSRKPAGIEAEGDEWLIPCDYVELPEHLEEAAALALNRWGEKGGYDEPILAEVLQSIAGEGEDALYGTGWANAVRRAVAVLFGDAVTCDIISVRRIPARTRRRVLRI